METHPWSPLHLASCPLRMPRPLVSRPGGGGGLAWFCTWRRSLMKPPVEGSWGKGVQPTLSPLPVFLALTRVLTRRIPMPLATLRPQTRACGACGSGQEGRLWPQPQQTRSARGHKAACLAFFQIKVTFTNLKLTVFKVRIQCRRAHSRCGAPPLSRSRTFSSPPKDPVP